MIYSASLQIYTQFKKNLGRSMNLSTDTFKMLLTSNAYVPNLLTDAVLADVLGELSGNGYARQTLGSVAYDEVGDDMKFDFADPVFSATGGNWTARRWVIFDDTVSSPTKPLVATGLINSADADVTVTSGNTLTFNVNASGLFVLS